MADIAAWAKENGNVTRSAAIRELIWRGLGRPERPVVVVHRKRGPPRYVILNPVAKSQKPKD